MAQSTAALAPSKSSRMTEINLQLNPMPRHILRCDLA